MLNEKIKIFMDLKNIQKGQLLNISTDFESKWHVAKIKKSRFVP